MNVQNPIETEQLGMMGAFVSSVPLVVIALDFPRTLSSLVPNGVWENLWYKRACFSLPRAQSPAPPPPLAHPWGQTRAHGQDSG